METMSRIIQMSNESRSACNIINSVNIRIHQWFDCVLGSNIVAQRVVVHLWHRLQPSSYFSDHVDIGRASLAMVAEERSGAWDACVDRCRKR
jgi:hypothetical protein